MGNNTPPPAIPGYQVFEQRRAQGKRGGIMMLVRNSLQVAALTGNEYAQQVQQRLPDGSRATINNVYLPPYDSLRKRQVCHDEAKDAVSTVLTATPATTYRLTCGDFNTRCGDKAPTVWDLQLSRTCNDQRVCARANWMVQLCELAEQHILNGAGQQEAAPYTCTTPKGSSAVDYILSQDPSHVIKYDATILEGWSDHVLLHLALPVAVRPPASPAATQPPATAAFRWDVGASN